jgi:uncharacterized protein YjiS (DUF1127 family)
MERTMRRSQQTGFTQVLLTPEQRGRVTQLAVARARDERARVLRGMASGTLRWLWSAARFRAAGLRRLGIRTAAAATAAWRAHAAWRERRRAMQALGGLDDRLLKDMGLHRSEIRSVIYNGDATRSAMPDAVAIPLPKPHRRTGTCEAAVLDRPAIAA